ncbi:MAG: plasmid stabilization system-related protein [Parcubacteria group bacterium Licking1014_1]|nr:MAG: plasmid stabilization system-related protein [Parcubacteria group bacterium Licking1014_1]
MLKWSLDFTVAAENDLAKLDKKPRRRIIDKLDWFCDNFDKITPLPLTGEWQGFFKIRVGDWRIVYEINRSKNLITVRIIDKRDEVYKRKK